MSEGTCVGLLSQSSRPHDARERTRSGPRCEGSSPEGPVYLQLDEPTRPGDGLRRAGDLQAGATDGERGVRTRPQAGGYLHERASLRAAAGLAARWRW